MIKMKIERILKNDKNVGDNNVNIENDVISIEVYSLILERATTCKLEPFEQDKNIRKLMCCGVPYESSAKIHQLVNEKVLTPDYQKKLKASNMDEFTFMQKEFALLVRQFNRNMITQKEYIRNREALDFQILGIERCES